MALGKEDMAKRFVDEIKLRAFDDKYIDKKEEREILQIAISEGVSFETARGALFQVCESNGYVMESAALDKTKDLLDTFNEGDGKIDEKEFNDAVTFLRKATHGRKKDVELKRMVVEIIQDNNYKTTQGWFSSWFTKVKKEVGM
jgi:hypothetical protein